MLLVPALLASDLSWLCFQKMGAGFLSTLASPSLFWSPSCGADALTGVLCFNQNQEILRALCCFCSGVFSFRFSHSIVMGVELLGFCQNLLPGPCSLNFPFSLGCFSSARAQLVSTPCSGKENPFCLFTNFITTCKKLQLISVYFALCSIHVLHLIIQRPRLQFAGLAHLV